MPVNKHRIPDESLHLAVKQGGGLWGEEQQAAAREILTLRAEVERLRILADCSTSERSDRAERERDKALAEAGRLRAKLDDTIGTLAGRNRKLDWTRGRLEAAEEVVEAARRLEGAVEDFVWSGPHDLPSDATSAHAAMCGRVDDLSDALEHYDAGRE